MSQTLGQTTPGRDLKKRFLYLGVAMLLGMFLIAMQLYRLQITEHEEYAAKSVANFVKEVRLRADRGMIKDRRGTILVDSRPSFDAFIIPAFCTDCSEVVLPKLAELLHWDEAQVAKVDAQVKAARRNAPFQPVPVKIDLSATSTIASTPAATSWTAWTWCPCRTATTAPAACSATCWAT